MPTYDYKCRNCSNVQEEVHSIKDCTDEISNEMRCKECKQRGMTRLISPVGLQTFSLMSPQQKRDSLKKRSREHFQKKIKDKFHQMNHPDYVP